MTQKTTALFLTLCVILFMEVTIKAADKKICRHCSQDITKTSINLNGYSFHPSHFICKRCQATITGKSYYFENDQFYDDTCYQIIHTIYCAHCNKVIKGRYTTYNDNKYHKNCYDIVSFFPCAFCNKNITSSYITSENKNYHDSCYDKNIALRCSLCAEVIEAAYMSDTYNNLYHSFHEDNSKACNYCGGYFDNSTQKKGIDYLDGRGICLICAKDAVIEESEVEILLTEVNEKLKVYQLDVPLHKISVHLVNKNELDRLVRDKVSSPQGYTTFYQEKNILGITLKRDINIYLLSGVPKMLMIKIIAHEFNHVWQGLHSKKDLESSFCEGSCNYVAYLVLQQYSDDDAFNQIENLFKDTDPDYGEGFRRVVQYVKEEGFSTWITRLKKHKSFPNGY